MLLEKLLQHSREQEGYLHSSGNKKEKILNFSLVLDWIQHLRYTVKAKKGIKKSNKQVRIGFNIPRINKCLY